MVGNNVLPSESLYSCRPIMSNTLSSTYMDFQLYGNVNDMDLICTAIPNYTIAINHCFIC